MKPLIRFWLALSLFLTSAGAIAVTCSDLLGTGVQGINTGSQLYLQNNASIRNVSLDWRFNFPSIFEGQNNNYHCAQTTSPQNSPDECKIVDSWQAHTAQLTFQTCTGCDTWYTLNSGDNRDFTGTVNKFGGLAMNSNTQATLGGFTDYYINNLQLNSGSTLYVPGGSRLHIGDWTTIDGQIIVTGTGTLQIYINGGLTVNAQSGGINPNGTPDQLALFINNSVYINGGTINGSIIQTDGNPNNKLQFYVQNSPTIRGLISVDGDFTMLGGTYIIDESGLDADFGSVCESTEPDTFILSGKLNVDNRHDVYISSSDTEQGTWITGSTKWTRTNTFSYELQAGQTYYLHVHGENTGDIAGFLGEFTISGGNHVFSNGSNRVLTNGVDWSVSNTGWGNYVSATVINGANGVEPWGSGFTGSVDANAEWIWSSDPYNHNEAYFTIAITPAGIEPIDISITSESPHALTCEGIEVTVKILRGGKIDTSYQGTISLSSSSVTGLWGDEDGSLKGTLSATNNGVASYQFSSSDQGIIVLNYQNPESGTTTLSAIADTAQDEVGPLEFAPSGYEITFDKGRLPYQVANQSFTLAVTAVEQSATDPLACVPIRNYEGLKELSFSVTYGQINGVDRAGTVELTVGGQAFPVDRMLRFQGGRSLPLGSLNYKDVGPITIQVQEKVAEFPENGKLMGQAGTTVVPKELAIVAVSDLSCNINNPAGTASSGDGFVAAGDKFTIMTAGLIANCSVPGTVTACDAQTALADVGNCIAPSFNEVVQLSVSKDTPVAGVLGSFTGSMALAVDDFNNGYTAPVDYQYAEVGSVNLTASMANFLGTGVSLSDSTVIGRFYPDHYLMDEKVLTTPCGGSMLYMGSDEPHLALEFTARNALDPSGITTNYDPNKGYTLASTPKVYLIDADGGRDLSDRLVFNAGSLPNWQSGQVLFDSDFLMTRLGEPDGSYPALDLGLVAKGHDDETFADLGFDCGEECDGVTLGTLNNVRYGRLVASNGYSPQGQTLHIPFLLEYWNGSKFVQNSEDSCSVLSLDMMSFNPDTNGSDELNVGTGTSQVRLTSNWQDYERSVTASKGTFWLRFSSPGTTGVVTYFMGIGGDSAPSENWLPWLKYDWDGDGSDDESISGIATFGTQRGSDRIISRREL